MPARSEIRVTGAYKITNTITGKVYVGGAYLSFEKRWKGHRYDLKAGKHCNHHLQASYDKHGEDAFVYSVLERCSPDKSTIIATEQKWLDALDACNPLKGYNMCPTAGSRLGVKCSDETRAKVSAAIKRNMTPELAMRRLAGIRLPESEEKRLAAMRSSKTRGKLREIARNRSPETRAKLSTANRGRVHTPEARERMTIANRGHTPEQTANRLAILRTPESRAKKSAITRKYHEGVRKRRAEESCFARKRLTEDTG